MDEVLVNDWTPGRQLWLKTPGRYSMDVGVEILRWIEGFDDCLISDMTWNSASTGNLIDVGIEVQLGNIKLSVMGSYTDLFIDRLAGNNRKFTTLCETIVKKFVTTEPSK